MIILLGVGVAYFFGLFWDNFYFFHIFQLGLKMHLFSYRPMFSYRGCEDKQLSLSILSMCDEYMTDWRFG